MSELPCPRLRDPDLDPVTASGRADGYRLEYLLEAPPGAVAIQQVETEITYLRGDDVVVRYTGCYAEWFRWGAEPQLDVHAFGLREDGWTPGDVRALTRQLGIKLPLFGPGGTRVRCTKRFRLALGEVDDARSLLDPDAAGGFGYLAEGPDGPPVASLTLDTGDARPPLALGGVTPGGVPPVGAGRFVTSSGWETCERFQHVLATRGTTFDPGAGYVTWEF